MKEKPSLFDGHGGYSEMAKGPLSEKAFVWGGEVRERWDGKGKKAIAREIGVSVSAVTEALQHVVLHAIYRVATAHIKVPLPGSTPRSEMRDMLRPRGQ